ncbi:hypothetical protein IP88_10855 [alpha proteobacterium AAP81b]|nr:hypothetical protein IP88_10855 [alpha proteobacterium AAP81b]
MPPPPPTEPITLAALVPSLCRHLADMRRDAGRPVLVGVSGAQGSGKSTLCRQLAAALGADGLAAAVLSLDDLYLPRAARLRLAAEVHPLLATRGVPGSHDVALGETVIAALLGGDGPVSVPRFDKAADDRAAVAEWVAAPIDVLLFEGWCVGATPQAATALVAPVNALEAEEDRDGRWRRHVNAALGAYAALWDRLDLLIELRAPGFEIVARWRGEQEAVLGARAMPPAALARFLAHYERLTRHMLAGGVARRGQPADIVLALDDDRRVVAARGLPPG